MAAVRILLSHWFTPGAKKRLEEKSDRHVVTGCFIMLTAFMDAKKESNDVRRTVGIRVDAFMQTVEYHLDRCIRCLPVEILSVVAEYMESILLTERVLGEILNFQCMCVTKDGTVAHCVWKVSSSCWPRVVNQLTLDSRSFGLVTSQRRTVCGRCEAVTCGPAGLLYVKVHNVEDWVDAWSSEGQVTLDEDEEHGTFADTLVSHGCPSPLKFNKKILGVYATNGVYWLLFRERSCLIGLAALVLTRAAQFQLQHFQNGHLILLR